MKKNLTAVVLVVALLGLAGTAFGQYTNLVANPQFTGTTGTATGPLGNWQMSGQTPLASVWDVVTGSGYAGQNAESMSRANDTLTQNLITCSGSNYTISFYFMATHLSTTNTIGIYFGNTALFSGTMTDAGFLTSVTNTGNQVLFTYTAAADNSGPNGTTPLVFRSFYDAGVAGRFAELSNVSVMGQQAQMLTVSFAPYNVTPGKPTLSPSQLYYTPGTAVTITAPASTNSYAFAFWSITDTSAQLSSATANPATLTTGSNACLLTANYAPVINRVPLNISAAFNMNCFAGPIVATQACSNSYTMPGWLGSEGNGYGNNFVGGAGGYSTPFDTSSNDGLTGSTYQYFVVGQSGVNTGTQGLPENGILYSVADATNSAGQPPRTYCMASVSGNYLLPGDWTEPAYNSALNGNLIGGSVTYGPNTYTASNNKYNAILVGHTTNANGGFTKQSVTAAVQPGYYGDVNFLLVAGLGGSGCEGSQIWANYADGTKNLCYTWVTSNTGSAPILTPATSNVNFLQVYHASYIIYAPPTKHGTGTGETFFEFAHPLTLDSTRALVSLTISSTQPTNTTEELAVFAATASASVTASNALTLQQTANGTISVSPSCTGYPYGATVTLTASNTTANYNFIGWNISPAGNATISGSSGIDTLTIYGPVTVSGIFVQNATFTNTTAASGGTGTISILPAGPYTPGQVISITATASPGYAFVGWIVTGLSQLDSPTSAATTLTVNSNFTLTASFTAIPNALTLVSAPYFGGLITTGLAGSYTVSSTQNVTTQPTNSNYVFAGWTVSDSGASVSPASSTSATFTMGLSSCVLTANYACVINRVPLNISNAFNMNCMVGPVCASQAYSVSQNIITWLGGDAQGFGLNYFGNGASNPECLICDTSSNDGLVSPASYLYKWSTLGNTYTGSQALPENGLLYSKADSSNNRTYCIASVSGNYLLPGDWSEPAYNSALNGTTIYYPGTSISLLYGPNTYTCSNNKFNALWFGHANNAGYGRDTPIVTVSTFQPGYYSDVNMLLAGSAAGCEFSAIWATYANVVNGSNSLKLYDWTATGSTPYINASTSSTNFTLVYITSLAEAKSGSQPQPNPYSEYLWEFTNPLTLDSTRLLVSLTFSNYRGNSNGSAVAVFGATATTSSTASNTLTLQQTANGTISASPSTLGYPYGATVTLTASANTSQNYVLSSWNVTPPGNGTITGTGSQATLTIYGPVTVSANFSVGNPSVTLVQNAGGTVTISPAGPTYVIGSTPTIAYTLNNGYTFANWTINDINNDTITLSEIGTSNSYTFTMPNYATTVSASFTVIPYSASASQNVTGGYFTMNPPSATYSYNQQAVLSATASNGYTLVNWIVTGAASLSSSTAMTSTLTVNGNFTLTASFTAITYTVSGVPSPANGSLALTPNGATATTGTMGQTITVTGTYQQTVAISTTPSQGYYFDHMTMTDTGHGAVLSSDSTTLTIGTSNVRLTAYFTASSYSVALGANGGVSSGAGTVTVSGAALDQYGSIVYITASAAPGYSFAGWLVTDTNNDTISPTLSAGSLVTYKFTMPSYAVTVAANFAITTYTVSGVPNPAAGGSLTLTPAGAGTMTGSVGQTITVTGTYQQTVAITETPNFGYYFDHMTMTDTGHGAVLSSDSTTLTIGTSNVRLTAYFTASSYPLALGPNGGVSSGAGTVTISAATGLGQYGATVYITETPSSGYTFTGLLVTDTNGDTIKPVQTAAGTYTFTMPAYPVTITAKFIPTVTGVPLNISGAFNMNCMVGPIVASQANLTSSNAQAWEGAEAQGFGTYIAGGNQNLLVCDSSSNDLNLPGNSYKYSCQGNGGFSGTGTLTGSQGLPENGAIYSVADAYPPRTYYIASVSGNPLLPGDWTEPAYNSGLLGIWLNSTSTIAYGPNTYTYVNNKPNAIWVGQTANTYHNMSATASFQPGYYSDINFVLTGQYQNTAGCAYTQIWANYADGKNGSNSLKLYDWGANTLPNITTSTAAPFFTQVYNVGAACRNGAGSKATQVSFGFNEYLYEFTTPLTIDPTRVLVSITISSTKPVGNYNNAIEIFAANATPGSNSPSNVLTLIQTDNGTISTTPSLAGYPFGGQVPLTASPNAGYIFNGWNVSSAGSIAGQTGSDTLTIYGNVTVSANFAVACAVTLNQTTGGTSTINPTASIVPIGATPTITATPIAGYYFDGWNVSSNGSVLTETGTDTLTVNGDVTVSANFTAYAYSATASQDVFGGSFTMNPDPSSTYSFNQHVALSATPSTGWQFDHWWVGGQVWVSGSSNPNATLTVFGDFSLRAFFSKIPYNVNTAVAGGSGTISVSPPPYFYGNKISFQAAAADGFTFATWAFDSGVNYDPADLTSASTTATVLGNTTLTASFTAIVSTLTGSVNPVAGGTVTLAGAASTTGTIGQTIALSETPANGYTFVNWTVVDDTGSDWTAALDNATSPTANLTIPDMGAVTDMNLTVIANYSQNSYTVTLVQPTDGTIGADSTTASYGQVVTLSQTANAGYTFQGYLVVSGASTIANGNQLTVIDNVTVTGSYSQNSYTPSGETESPPAGGSITLSNSGPYTYGQVISISAAANDGWVFNGFALQPGSLSIISNSTQADTTLTVYDDFYLTADFTAIVSNLTGSVNPVGAGTVTLNGAASTTGTIGQTIALSATAIGNYTFASWTVLDDTGYDWTAVALDNSASPTANLTIPDMGPVTDMNLTVIANYVVSGYTLTVNQTTGGNVTVTLSQALYHYGDTVTIAETPAASYQFTGWNVSSNGSVSGETGTDTLTINGNVTLSANFTQQTFSITAYTSTTWLYQNTPVATRDRHAVALTISATDTWGNHSYTATLTQTGPGVVTPTQNWVFGTTLTPTGSAPVVFTSNPAKPTGLSGWLVGGRCVAAPMLPADWAVTGSCTVAIAVQGDVSGPANLATAAVTVEVRVLGDILDKGAPSGTGKTYMIDKLNFSTLPAITNLDQEVFDLNGVGGASGNDKSILIGILNYQVVP